MGGAGSASFRSLTLGDAAGSFAPTLVVTGSLSSTGLLTIDRSATLKQGSVASSSLGQVIVASGGLITHAANANTRAALVNLNVSGDFNLQAGASIAVSGLGYASFSGGAYGPGAGGYDGGGGGGGGGHGAAGGGGGQGAPGGAANDNVTNPTDLGSGGGGYPAGYATGGNGGGAVSLNVGGILSLNGVILANGGDGVNNSGGNSWSGGGGAGGTVNLTAGSLTGAGVVQANGGSAATATSSRGGGGGGGRIALVVTGTDSSSLNLQAVGGAGYVGGGAGVIALKSPGAASYGLIVGDVLHFPTLATPIPGATLTFSSVTLNNAIATFDAASTVTVNTLVVAGTATVSAGSVVLGPGGLEVKSGALLMLAANSLSGGKLVVDAGGTFMQTNTAPLGFTSVSVAPGGALTHAANRSTRTAILNLSVTGDFNLQAGATVAVSGMGYASYSGGAYGPGAGGYDGGGGGGGGGHGGGGGGGGQGAPAGGANDSVTSPTDLGSGGGGYPAGYQTGGNGGGAAILSVGGTLTLNGAILANGGDGVNNSGGNSWSGGGGAGGTVNLTAGSLTGAGVVQANGGSAATAASSRGGGGGGGRIALLVTGTDSSRLNLQANSGSGYVNGGAGVISLKTPGGANYNVSIGDLTKVPQVGTPVPGSPTFSTVTLNNSIVAFDPAGAVTVNSLIVAGTATVTANSLTLGSGGLEVKPGALLMLSANSASGGALLVDGGATFQQTNAAQLNFTSVNVAPGGVLTHATNRSSRAAILNLNVSGDFNLQAGASIAVSGLGYASYSGGAYGPGAGGYDGGGGGGGGGHGGNGGGGGQGAPAGTANDNATNPTDLGSGGGGYPAGYPTGGNGGGAAIISVGGALTLNGAILANGGGGVNNNGGNSWSGGGGAGGSVNLTAGSLTGSGIVQANGGTAAPAASSRGGGGGGGRIALVVTGADSSNLNLRANGGAGGVNGGAGVISLKTPGGANYNLSIGDLTQTPQAGTPVAGSSLTFSTVTLNHSIVSFDPASTVGVNSMVIAGRATLTANNIVFGAGGLEIKPGAALLLTANSTSGGRLLVDSGGVFTQTNTNALGFTSVNVASGGVLTHSANRSTRAAILNLNVSGDFNLQAGASIAVSGLGYASYSGGAYGPGAGGYDGGGGGGGGGHGGAGGTGGQGAPAGAGNDNIVSPVELGSGGGGYPAGYQTGGNGGGAAILNVGGTLTLNGTILANGGDGVNNSGGNSWSGGGGAGGSVNLTAGSLTGAGVVQANGGTAAPAASSRGGGGGGGRVSVVVTGADSSSLNIQANGGYGGVNGGAGVIALEGVGAAAYNLNIGDLVHSPQAGTLIPATPAFAAVAVSNAVVNFDAASTASVNSLVVAGTATITANGLTLGTGGLEVKPGAVLMIAAGVTSGGALQVDGGATFQQTNTAQLGFTAVNVAPGGVLTHAANTSARSAVLNLSASGDFNLQSGAAVAVSGLGYASHSGGAYGSGAGGYDGGGGGGGGGHGGAGGSGGQGAPGGGVNDSAANPVDLGSGGGGYPAGYTTGGSGGGAAILKAGGTLTVNGSILANGFDGINNSGGNSWSGGGGAGGTINLSGAFVSGNGLIQANGGSAAPATSSRGGGGGGGRVALTGCGADRKVVSVLGGAGSNAGQAGSVNPTIPPGCPSAPATPLNLSIVAAGESASGQTFLTASWSATTQTSFYTLQASTAPDFSGVLFSSNTAANAATLAGVTPGAAYFLRVSASNGVGASAFSTSVSTLTPADLTPPRAPTLQSAVGSAGARVLLNWTAASSGEQTASFNLYRATSSPTATAGLTPVLLHAAATSYVDVLPTDGTYFYAVTGLDPSFNESGLSNVLSALALHAGPPAPANLAAVFDPALKQITLSWTASTGTVASYNVYRATYPAAGVMGRAPFRAGTNAVSLVDAPSAAPSAALDATYYYLVTAVDAVGNEGAPSNLAAAVFDVHAPVVRISGVTDGQYTSANVTPSIVITDFSPWVSTITLNGRPFQSSPVVYASPSQTVGEGGTASVSCSSGTILGYTSIWAASCGAPTNCGSCPIGGASCAFTYNNANCGDVAVGCSKNGTLTINCGTAGTTLTQAGTYFLSVQAQDVYANASSSTLSFTIDKTPPSLTILSPANGLVTNQNVLVVYVATDDFTPATQISVVDSRGNLFASSTTITSESAQTLTLTAKDLAGNQTTSSVTFTLDKTPPAIVTDLRATASNPISGAVSLAWTVPADNLTGIVGAIVLASPGSSFATVAASQTISGQMTTGTTATFTMTLSTQQPSFLAVESIDGASNMSVLSNRVLFNPIPPQTSVAPVSGSVLSRPTNVTVQVADVAAIMQVSFAINGSAVALSTTAPYAFFWDTRNYPDGAYTLLVTAQDATGNVTSSSFSYTLSYAPPAVPNIALPAASYVTNIATISVAGTAEGGTTVQLLINGTFAGNVYLANGPTTQNTFQFVNVPLAVEGINAVTARSVDSRGTSANAPTIQVTLLKSPPPPPSGLTANSAAGGVVSLTWITISTDTRTSFYKIYRSTDPAQLPTGGAPPANLLTAGNVRAAQFTDTPATDGVYYYALTANDLAGNESVLSGLASALSDRIAPTATFYLDFATAPLGPGSYPADLALSKVLAQPPLLTFTPPAGSPSPLPLTPLTATLWHTTVTVTSAMFPGNALLGFSGTDLVGNVGTMIIRGGTLALDTRGPVGTIAISSASPVTTGILGISVTLDKPAASTPTLTIALQGGGTRSVLLTAAGGGNRNWSGQVAITSTTGDGTATFAFSATDLLGNVSNVLAGAASFVIKTVPPGSPVALRPSSLPNGRVSLSWSAPGGQTVAFYRVYRDGAFLSSAPRDGVSAFVDTAPDGVHQYGVTAVDPAGNESAPVTALGLSKSAPPSAPIGLASSLNSSSQIQLSWQLGSTDTVRYLLYRATTTLVGLSGQFARDAQPPFIDVPSQDANYHYVVTALDQAGNESAPSNETAITYDRAGPQITIGGVADGGLYNATVYPTFAAASLILDTSSVRGLLDGQVFASGAAVPTEGPHTLAVNAANMTGHLSSATVSFVLDKTPPAIVLSGIQNGQLLKSSAAINIVVTDLHPGATTLLLYNQLTATTVPYNSGNAITLNGQYVFSAYATDLAGNASTATLTFQMDIGPLPPSNLVVQVQNSANLSWSQPEPDVIAYRVYRDGVNISGSFLRSTTFVDPGFTAGSAHLYEVSAVDSQGVEGPRARASVPAVTLSVPPLVFMRGFFDAVRPIATSASTATLMVGPAVVSLFDARGLVTTATATPVALSAGLSAPLEADIATPANLASAISVVTSLNVPTDPGAAVFLQQTVSMSAADPQSPLLEIFPAALVPGTLGSVQVRLYNRGSAPMDIPTALVSGGAASPVNSLQVRLRAPDGTLLATGNLQQTAGASAAVIPGRGQTDFVSIPGGQSSLFGPIQVLVPNTASGNLIVEAAVSTPTFNLPFVNTPGSRSFLAQTNSAVVQSIPYTATVAPSQPVFDQGQQQIPLSGRATDSSGIAVAFASVTVHVLQNGYDRQLQAVTDSSGGYTSFFNPAPSEAGVYSLFAANPQIVSGAIQSSFTIVGMTLNYGSYNVSIVQSASLSFNINLTNTGTNVLTGFRVSTANVSAPGVTLTVDPASVPQTLAAGQSAALKFTVAATAAASNGALSFTIAESHGFFRALPISVQVAPALPNPSASPQAFQVGVLAGQAQTQSITLSNTGFAPWTGVTLTSPTLNWVQIQGSPNIGDIPPGGNANVSLAFNPPANQASAIYNQNPLIQVVSSNAATIPINVGITVTSSRQGTLVFNVINADKPKDINGLGVPVAGAAASLTSVDVPGLTFRQTADANGIAQFVNIPTGNYAWTISAQGFQSNSGTSSVDPGLTKTIQSVMAGAAVTYTWSVTPTTIVDKYNVGLNLTFKTDVPAPIVVIDPTVLTFDIASHVDAFGQFTVTNLGLVSAFNVDLTPNSPDGEVFITLPFTTIAELKAGQSVTVPFKISHGQIPGGGPHCHTNATVAAAYKYTCAYGTTTPGKVEPLKFNIGTPGTCGTPASVSISPAGVAGGSPGVPVLPGGGASIAVNISRPIDVHVIQPDLRVNARKTACQCNHLASLSLNVQPTPPIIAPQETAVLNAVPQFADDGAPKNCEVTYKWGPNPPALGILNASGASATFIAGPSAGSQNILVQGTDSSGAQASKSAAITIEQRACFLSVARVPLTQLIPAGNVTIYRTICPYDCPEPRTRTLNNYDPPGPAAFPLCKPREFKSLMD